MIQLELYLAFVEIQNAKLTMNTADSQLYLEKSVEEIALFKPDKLI